MPDRNVKILLLGPPSVGKTSLLLRFVNNDFNTDYGATIGAKFLSKNVSIYPDGKDDEKIIQLTLWDIGGQARFLDLRTTFYKGAAGALLVFDLIRKETFEEINNWHAEMTKVLEREIPFILIGNKSDLEGYEVDFDVAAEYAKSMNSFYIQTSAKTGDHVEDAFIRLAEKIWNS